MQSRHTRTEILVLKLFFYFFTSCFLSEMLQNALYAASISVSETIFAVSMILLDAAAIRTPNVARHEPNGVITIIRKAC